MTGDRLTLLVDGVPMVVCPSTLAEAAESARSGAKARPGVKYEIKSGGTVVAHYVVRRGRMEAWVR